MFARPSVRVGQWGASAASIGYDYIMVGQGGHHAPARRPRARLLVRTHKYVAGIRLRGTGSGKWEVTTRVRGVPAVA